MDNMTQSESGLLGLWAPFMSCLSKAKVVDEYGRPFHNHIMYMYVVG